MAAAPQSAGLTRVSIGFRARFQHAQAPASTRPTSVPGPCRVSHARGLPSRAAVRKFASSLIRRPTMPNVVAVLREEIVRLARKEVRRQTEKLRRGAVQYRKNITALNRNVQDLRRQLTLATAQARRPDGSQATESAGSRVRFSPTGLRSLRKRLGLSAEPFGRLVGVSPQTVYNWEHGVTRPRAQQLTRLASARTMGKREARLQLESVKRTSTKNPRKALKLATVEG